MESLRGNGVSERDLTDWKFATPARKDLQIDQRLAERDVCVDKAGGRVNLVRAVSGWLGDGPAAARFADKVAGPGLAVRYRWSDGPIRRMVHAYPESFCEELAELGGGAMPRRFMLRGWKNMRAEQHYMPKHFALHEYLDDPACLCNEGAFGSWCGNPLDLPGRRYLQMNWQIFKGNRPAYGSFVAPGRTLNPKAIRRSSDLLDGESDDITTKEPVFNATRYLDTSSGNIVQ
jgi:hypothetical protein